MTIQTLERPDSREHLDDGAEFERLVEPLRSQTTITLEPETPVYVPELLIDFIRNRDIIAAQLAASVAAHERRALLLTSITLANSIDYQRCELEG